MAVVIEDFRFSDVAGIRRLYEGSSEALKEDFRSPTILTSRKWLLITYLSATPLRRFLPARVDVKVARSGGEVVGFCYLAERRGRADLGIMVKEGFQGQGIGDRLIGESVRGRTEVHLNVLNENQRAIALYRKHGFETEMILNFMVKRDKGVGEASRD